MNTWTMTIRDGSAHLMGVSMGGDGKVLAQNSKSVVIKWPREVYYMPYRYHPAKTAVYVVVEVEAHGLVERLKVEELVSWEDTSIWDPFWRKR